MHRIALVLRATGLLAMGTAAAVQAATAGTATYEGNVRQKVPGTYTGNISLRVVHRSITKLSFKVGTICDDGAAVLWEPTSPKGFRVKISPQGSFSYDKTLPAGRVQLRGSIHGKTMNGHLFGYVKVGSHGTCSMFEPAPFTAHR